MSDSGDESSVYSDLENDDEEENEGTSETSEYESELEENEEDDEEKQVDFDKYDSSDEEDLRNTVGNIPVVWYNDLDHVGYDLEGRKLRKPSKKSEIDEFLSKIDDPNYWKTVTDKQTGKDVVLPDEALATVSNVLKMRYPQVGYNPYQPFLDLYSHETMIHPVTNRPEHKRSFIPSALEKKKVSKMVHAIKMGWIKPRKPTETDTDTNKFYDLWASDQQSNDPLSKSQLARIKMQIPAPKMKLPGHNESYNPPPEYLFSPEEMQKWSEQEPEDRRIDFIPAKFDSLRHVPAYANFMKDRFERCVDLYLAPRQRKMRLNVDPNDLLPKLPKPQDLHPFPTTMALVYKGHNSLVRAVAVEPSGQFLASGSDDGTIRVWEVHSGRCVKIISVDGVVHSLVWCPNVKLSLIAASVGSNVFLINSCVGDRLITSDTDVMLNSLCSSNLSAFDNSGNNVVWSLCNEKQYEDGFRLKLSHKKDVKQITWHIKGDYFATVCPEGGNSSVFVHQLSKIKSQTPFNKSKGLIQKVLFHPTRPYFFVATQRHVRVYNLLKQQLTRKLMSNCKLISCMALHPKGDNLVVGSYDSRLDWFDLDLSVKPYKTFRHHKGAVRSVSFHPHYPLFATASDDGTVIVSHGMVYNDLLQNPLIVPVKILRGHGVHDNLGVVDCIFHPVQPWLISCGSDSNIRLYV